MHAWALWLDSDVHSRLEVELWIAGGLLLVIAWFARTVFRDVRTDVDSTQKGLKHQTRRVDRHELEIVDKLRDGNPFPPLSED